MEGRGGEDWEDVFEEDARFWEVGTLAKGGAEVGFEVGKVGLVEHLVFSFLFFFPNSVRISELEDLGWFVVVAGEGGREEAREEGRKGGRGREEVVVIEFKT